VAGTVVMDGSLLAEYDDPSCLIYGIGNVGRPDDGLGWAFIDWLEDHGCCPRAQAYRGYQLHLEDADLISRASRVLFVDSTKDPAVGSYELQRPQPRLDISFTSHAISIPSVMATSQRCFGRVPDVRVLAIRGYEWELTIGLTPRAADNLDHAVADLSSERRALLCEPA
jgi:hydrogenase maturation protease